MKKIGKFLLLAGVMAFCIAHAQLLIAGDNQGTEPTIRIDVPVKLETANVVFNMNHFVMRADMPVGLRYMDTMSKAFKENNTKGQIIGIFYSEAAHFTLNDKAYNAARGVSTGNPYKALIADLISRGVQVEECGESMKQHKWSNDDLLPGVKVNTAAVQRLIQLEQQGFVQVQP